MEKTYWGLSKTAFAFCIGIPCTFSIMAFINTGEFNIGGTFFGVLIMVGLARLLRFVVSKVKKLF